MSRVYLSVREVETFHQAALDQDGGSAGLRDRNALESAVFRPQCGYYGDVIEEAAALMESLVNNHPFVDGNKRTAFTATDVFLRMNGLVIAVDEREAEKFLLDNLERGSFKFAVICDWLREVTQPFTP